MTKTNKPKIFQENKPSNPCIRCGKERKTVKTWKEKIGTSVITYTQNVCNDPECQKLVDKQNLEIENKRKLRLQNSLHHKPYNSKRSVFRI